MAPAFGVLGPLEVLDATGTPLPLGGQKPRELLAGLLLHRGQVVSVDRLVDCLWGEEATAGAAITLRTYVGQVRRILARAAAPATLESRPGGYCLEVAREHLDAELFQRGLLEGQDLARAGDHEGAGDVLGRALELWRADVLVDLGKPEFAVGVTARLDELRLVAWEGWVDAQLALGRHRLVVTRLQALVDEHPFRERFSAQLMLALYRSGRQADALAVSAATRLRLADELGLDPGPELRELETSMLQQSPHLDPDPPAPAPRWPVAGAGAGSGGDAHAARSLAQGHMELLEREDERALLADAIASAAAGRGTGVAVAGDAGTGKSTLVQVACADGPRVRLLRSGCDPLSMPRPLGPLRDVAVAAGLAVLQSGEEVLLSHVCEAAYGALASEPTVLVVEDIHWIDAATADVLRFLVRRVGSAPLTLIVTYREHEVGPRHPARQLLGDLARLGGHSTVTLRPLSEDGVRRLVQGSSLDPQRVHALTGGNPFFVTEIARDPERPLPGTVRDAVLARTAEVTPEDFEVLQLIATAPERLDERVLRALGVDIGALRRLEDTGLLTRGRAGLAFRHELARQAVESTVPAGGGPDLHGRLLDALERADVLDPAVLTHHALAAHDSERVYEYACAAADEAVRAGAHTEAAGFLQVALDNVRDNRPAERADLLQRLGFEQYLLGRLSDAIDTVEATIPLWSGVGNGAGLASAHETSAVFTYYDGRRREAELLADRAAAIAGDRGARPEQGSARATRGLLAFLRNEVELALACADDAARIADDVDDDFTRLRARFVRTLANLSTGDQRHRSELDQQIRDARRYGWDELASTGYSQLACLDVEHRRLVAAEDVLGESLPFTFERDLPICRHWQTSVRARVSYQRGRWDDALRDAEHVIHTDGMPVAKLWPHLMAALVPLRREGRPDQAELAAACALADSVDEPLRRLPVYSAFAEVMWLTGVHDERVTRDAVDELAAVAGTPGSEWAVGELAEWLARLGLVTTVTPVAPPYLAARAGRFAEAAAWWRDNGEPFAEAMVLGDSPDPAHRATAVELLEGLGATATAARVRDAAAVATPGEAPSAVPV